MVCVHDESPVLPTYLIANRRRLVTAALKILRAYHVDCDAEHWLYEPGAEFEIVLLQNRCGTPIAVISEPRDART